MSESGNASNPQVPAQPHGLLQARLRDLVPLFLWLFILIVLLSLGVARYCSIQEKNKQKEHQALQEQQQREAYEEMQRQAVRREEALRAAEEQRRRHAEARRRLEQEGVRGVALPTWTPEIPRAVGVSLVVRSAPEHAEVFLDWVSKGHTPLRLEGVRISGQLVVVKDGYRSWFRDVNYGESAELPVDLPAEEPHPHTRLLLVADNTASEIFAALSTRLLDEGFTVAGAQEAAEFQRAVSRAGGLSHPALRAWARAKFNTALLAMARVRQSLRELDQQGVGYAGLGEALKGVVRAEVSVELVVYDLGSGHHLTAVSAQAADFGLDRLQSLHKALERAAGEVTHKLRLWRQG